MKHTFIHLIALTLLASACSKNDDSGSNDSGNEQLIPASTGWKTISTIPYQNLVSGFDGGNSMTPYDLTLVGNDLALLYSDDYTQTGGKRHAVMKLMLNNGLVDAKAKAVGLRYDRGGNAVQLHRFIPGSFTTISGAFQNNDLLIYDEVSGPNAGQSFGSINALPLLRWYPDGTILAGVKDGPHSSAIWSYKYPATGNFDYMVNVWNGDSVTNMLSSPMKLGDGVTYDLVLGKCNGTIYCSVMKYISQSQAGTAPNYQMISRTAVPALDASKHYATVTAGVQDDAQTLLLAEADYSSGDVVYKQLHAFRWTRGANSLANLYNVPVNDNELSRMLLTLTTNTQMPNEVRLTPDGTAYFMYHYAASQGAGRDYTALTTISQAGIKQYGKLMATEMEARKRMQYALDCVRYFNGAYYAVVYPTMEYEFDKSKPEFRIEVVKLVP